jgi:hypothetical protein
MSKKKVIDPTSRYTIIDQGRRIIKGVVYYAHTQYVRSARFSSIKSKYKGGSTGYKICLKRK